MDKMTHKKNVFYSSSLVPLTSTKSIYSLASTQIGKVISNRVIYLPINLCYQYYHAAVN